MMTYQERLAKKYTRVNDETAAKIRAVRGTIREMKRSINPWAGGLDGTNLDIIDQMLGSAECGYIENRIGWKLHIENAIVFASDWEITVPGLAELAAELNDPTWGDKADRAMMEYPHQN